MKLLNKFKYKLVKEARQRDFRALYESKYFSVHMLENGFGKRKLKVYGNKCCGFGGWENYRNSLKVYQDALVWKRKKS